MVSPTALAGPSNSVIHLLQQLVAFLLELEVCSSTMVPQMFLNYKSCHKDFLIQSTLELKFSESNSQGG